MRELWLDAAALKHNVQQVKQCAPHSKILAMVKANGYGHGLAWTAKHLAEAGVDGFGVASLCEADIIHQLALERPVVLMEGVQTLEELTHALAHNYALVVHNLFQVELLENIATDQQLMIWLKVDTGMHRLGFAPEQIKHIWQRLNQLNVVQKPIILTTHFADASDLNKPTTSNQLQLFYATKAKLPADAAIKTSLAHSAAILQWPETHTDWVRPGIMLYGASPFSNQEASDYHLKPVMTVHSRIIEIKNVPAGAKIGYGGTFTCEKPMRIGIVAFGYGDGYPYHAHLSKVLIKKNYYPVIGRISMDMLHIDLTDAVNIKLYDLVTLFGENLPIESLASAANTIPYELLTQMHTHRMTVFSHSPSSKKQ